MRRTGESARERDSDRAYEILKNQLITLVIEPGETISEAVLQERLGIGRTPIREALLRLAQEGLVTILPRRGMIASEISVVEIHEVFELRLYLEGLAARLAAARLTPEDEPLLDEVLQAAQQPPDSPTYHLAVDTQFHNTIVQIARNRHLYETLERLRSISLRLQYLTKTRMVQARDELSDYDRIIAAIRARDAERSEALMREHIAAAKQRALAFF